MNTSTHLGDGVYASFDGYHIWLAANHHANRVVALEPAVFDTLVAYRADLMKRLTTPPEIVVAVAKLSVTAVGHDD